MNENIPPKKTTDPAAYNTLFIGIMLVALLIPVLLYYLLIGRAPSISADAARKQLMEQKNALPVDIRPPEAFKREHLVGAFSWPNREIQRLTSAKELPENLRGKRLFLLCDNGILNAKAALKLRALGLSDVYAVKDGYDGWTAAVVAVPARKTSYSLLVDAAGNEKSFPTRPSSRVEQWAAVLSAYVVKPLYMLLSLVLIIWLRRSRTPELVMLRWAMIFFLFGEAACAVNYIAFGHQSHLADYLHCGGMAAAFAFTIYALLTGVDRHLLHFAVEKRRCALDLCAACYKQTDVPCGLRRVFLLLMPCAMILALIPLCVAPRLAAYNTVIFNTPFNYSHLVLFQIFETRVCPAYALIFLSLAFIIGLLKKRDGLALAEVLFAAGMGCLGFGFMRLFLFRTFPDSRIWSAFWEETTEFIFIAGVLCVLWIFRARLFPAPETTPPGNNAAA